MKKSILATTIAASMVSAAAFAADTTQESSLTASGKLTVGGYYHTQPEDNNFVSSGATGMDIFVDWKQGNWSAQYGVELDIHETGTKVHAIDELHAATIDAWVGYDFGFANVRAGFAGDSALDDVDAFYDKSVEFAYGLNDANDVGTFVTIDKTDGTFVYGLTAYADRGLAKADQAGANGYVGYRGDALALNVGFEVNDSTSYIKEIGMVNGTYQLGALGLGASYGFETNNNGSERNMYGATAGVSMGEKVYVGGGYHFVECYEDSLSHTGHNAANLGAKYFFSDNLVGLFDVQHHVGDEGGKDGETDVFLRLDYTL